MPNFSPTKFDFGSQINRRREAETAKSQAAVQAFMESLQKGRDDTVASIAEIGKATAELATRGGTEEQIDKGRDAIFALAKTFAGRLDQVSVWAEQAGRGSEIPMGAGDQFIDSQLQLFETTIQSASLATPEAAGTQAAEGKLAEDERIAAALGVTVQQVAQARGRIPDDFETLSPEETAELGFPPGAIVQRSSNNEVKLTFDPSESMSAFQEKVDALTLFVGEELAVVIASGRFAVSVNPITNERVVLDIATGKPIGRVNQPTEPQPLPSVVTPGTDTSTAVGGLGFFKNALNILTDAVGAGATFEGTQQATTALNVIQQQTKLLLQSVVPGRPAKDIREGLKKLTVTPNSIFQGEARAKSKLEGTKRMIDNEIVRMENMLQTEIRPEDRSALLNNLGPLKEISRSHQDLINAFDKVDEELDEELEALLDKHAPKEDE